jgi:hypothetical protein
MPEKSPDEIDHYITREQAAGIALAAAKEASRQTLSETFALLGVNLSDFESMQSFREDLDFARRARRASETAGHRAWTTVVSIVAAAVAIGLWEYIRILLGKGS